MEQTEGTSSTHLHEDAAAEADADCPKHNDDLTDRETIQRFLPRFRDSLLDIGDFLALRKIGEGAFACVYRCRRRSTDANVAVKVLKPKMFDRERDVYDFFLEAQLLRKIQNPFVVDFKGICYGNLEGTTQGPSLHVVTEYMDSGSLKDWIRAQMRQPERAVYSKRNALLWMLQVARGLNHLHTLPLMVIHRDLKPENILLQSKGAGTAQELTAKLADFGLSVVVSKKNRKSSVKSIAQRNSGLKERIDSTTLPELLKHGKERYDKNADSLEKALAGVSVMIASGRERTNADGSGGGGVDSTGRVLTGKTGSLMYMAPEVLRCEKYDEKVDVFSFGIVLYEALQGFRIASVLPENYNITDIEEFARDVADGYRMQTPPYWPEEIRILIEDCWNGDPSKRPSMKEVVTQLTAMYNSGMFQPKRKKSTSMLPWPFSFRRMLNRMSQRGRME